MFSKLPYSLLTKLLYFIAILKNSFENSTSHIFKTLGVNLCPIPIRVNFLGTILFLSHVRSPRAFCVSRRAFFVIRTPFSRSPEPPWEPHSIVEAGAALDVRSRIHRYLIRAARRCHIDLVAKKLFQSDDAIPIQEVSFVVKLCPYGGLVALAAADRFIWIFQLPSVRILIERDMDFSIFSALVISRSRYHRAFFRFST